MFIRTCEFIRPQKTGLSRFKREEKMAQHSTQNEDWHPADVVAALHKRRVSLRALVTGHGYHESAGGKALRRSWPAVERIIAAELGRQPAELWPSRYYADGTAKRERSSKKSITGRIGRNVQATVAA